MDSDVQKIKDRLNIVDVVGQYVQLKRAGKNWTARCPFHKERTPSFHVSPERGTYTCFGCGEKGDIFSFIQKIDGVDFPTALKLMAEKAGITLEPRSQKAPEQKEKEERLREVCEAAVAFFENELQKRADVVSYLKNRGVKDETISHWRIGYAPAQWEGLSKHLTMLGLQKDDIVDAGFALRSEKRKGEVFDRFRGRIIFPIFDAAGQPIAVSGRYFEKVAGSKQEGEPAKYVNSPETALFKKSRILYGFDRAKSAIRKADCILLVEGQFDLILSQQSGLPFTVALSGTALTQEHLSLLSRLSKRLVLALDADEAGIRAGLKSAHLALTAGFDVKIPAFPAGKDPADMAHENPELLKAAIRTSKTAVEFFLNTFQYSARDERGYKKTVEQQVLPLIAAMESKIDQEHFISIVAHSLEVPQEAVRAEVARRIATAASSTMNGKDPHPLQEESLTALEKKAAMLIAYFGTDSKYKHELEKLLGADRMAKLQVALAPEAEVLRFRFEQELGEHTTPEAIGQEMFSQIEQHIMKERFKMKFS